MQHVARSSGWQRITLGSKHLTSEQAPHQRPCKLHAAQQSPTTHRQHPPGSCSSSYAWLQGNSADGTRKKWIPFAAFHSTSGMRSRQLASARLLTRGSPSASNVRRRQDLHAAQQQACVGAYGVQR